jgi:hypothetical protein
MNCNIQTAKVDSGATAKSNVEGKKAKLAYQSPKVVVLGSAVDLVQGAGNASFADGRFYYVRR